MLGGDTLIVCHNGELKKYHSESDIKTVLECDTDVYSLKIDLNPVNLHRGQHLGKRNLYIREYFFGKSTR